MNIINESKEKNSKSLRAKRNLKEYQNFYKQFIINLKAINPQFYYCANKLTEYWVLNIWHVFMTEYNKLYETLTQIIL